MNYKQQWYQNNIVREREKQKQRDIIRKQDPERIKYLKEWKDNNPHTFKISSWKNQGMKLRPGEDWLSIWFFYESCDNCEICDVKLTRDRQNKPTTKSLHHSHDTGYIMNVLCHSCNRTLN
jgi:hypothetical protein